MCAEVFVLPSQVILTGTEGIATSLSYYFDSYWLFIALYLLFQAVLLAFAFTSVSRVFAVRSMLVVGTVVASLALLPELRFAQPEPQNERIILVLFGGILAGPRRHSRSLGEVPQATRISWALTLPRSI